MHSLHPFSLLTYFVHEQRVPSFVLTGFLGVYKGKLAFEVASRQNDHRPAILDLGSIAEKQTSTSQLSVKQNEEEKAKNVTASLFDPLGKHVWRMSSSSSSFRLMSSDVRVTDHWGRLGGCVLGGVYVPCICRMPGGVTVGDSGLCCCDITVMVDWALKINYISTYLCCCVPAVTMQRMRLTSQ